MNEPARNWWIRLAGEANFALTNCLPRRAASRFMGWFSGIRNPLVRDISIAAWRAFSDLDLDDARKTRFDSLQDCFTRQLLPDARPVDADPDVLTSPCDAIVGACGSLQGVTALQAKGRIYEIAELLADRALAERYRDGCFATLRLTATMYHRFHAPHACRVERVTYVSGDAWNVNPPAVRRVDRLYCRNERAVLRARLERTGDLIVLVPVAAILVRSIRFSFIPEPLVAAGSEPREHVCGADFAKGDELGWFQHGSTLLVFAPAGYALCPGIEQGARIRMGGRLMRLR